MSITHNVSIKIYDENDNEIHITKLRYYKGRAQTLTEPEEFPEIEILEPDVELSFEQTEQIEVEFCENYLRRY